MSLLRIKEQCVCCLCACPAMHMRVVCKLSASNIKFGICAIDTSALQHEVALQACNENANDSALFTADYSLIK